MFKGLTWRSVGMWRRVVSEEHIHRRHNLRYYLKIRYFGINFEEQPGVRNSWQLKCHHYHRRRRRRHNHHPYQHHVLILLIYCIMLHISKACFNIILSSTLNLQWSLCSYGFATEVLYAVLIFSLFLLFWKKKESKLMWSSSCLSVYPPYQLLKAWVSFYETWYVYHGTWAHLKCLLHKFLPSVCVSICVFPIVARQRLGKKKLPW
jgi:hypothetical protein